MRKNRGRLPDWHPENPEGMYRQVFQLEKKLKLPRGFCSTLEKENDWSFIIKIYALLEAAIAEAVSRKVGNAAVSNFIVRRTISEKRQLAEDLGLLTRGHSNFVAQIAQIRNSLVHNIRNIDFKFKDFFRSLSEAERRATINRLLGLVELKDRKEKSTLEMLEGDPKFFIWMGVLFLMNRLGSHIALTELEAEEQRGIKRFAKKELSLQRKFLKLIEDMAWDEKTRGNVGELLYDAMKKTGARKSKKATQLRLFT